MKGWKHKYIFYYFPKWNDKHGKFLFFERSGDGKAYGHIHNLQYDYYKLY